MGDQRFRKYQRDMLCADWQGDWRYSTVFDPWIVSNLSRTIKNSGDHAVSQQIDGFGVYAHTVYLCGRREIIKEAVMKTRTTYITEMPGEAGVYLGCFLLSACKNVGKSSLGRQLDLSSGNLNSFHMQASG